MKAWLDGISSKIQEIRKNDLLRSNNKNVLQNSNNTQYTVGQSTFNLMKGTYDTYYFHKFFVTKNQKGYYCDKSNWNSFK